MNELDCEEQRAVFSFSFEIKIMCLLVSNPMTALMSRRQMRKKACDLLLLT